MTAARNVRLFLGDPSVVDPLVHTVVDERMGQSSQDLDFEIVRHGERPLAEVEAALRQVGMFSRDRCLWLRGFIDTGRRGAATEAAEGDDAAAQEDGGGAAELLAMLEKGLPEGTLLIVSAANLDARSRLYKWLSRNADVVDRRLALERSGQRSGKLSGQGLAQAVAERLRELGVRRIGPGAIDEIVQRSGNALGETLQEVDRLVLSQTDPTRLGVEDVRDGMRDLALGWVFSLTNALEARDLAAAESQIERLLAAGEPPLRLVAVLASHFAELVAARPLVDQLPRGSLRMKGPAFLAGPAASLPEAYRGWKGYFRLRAAASFRLEELRGLHRQVLDLDVALKSSPAPAILLFSKLLQSACIRPAA